MAIKELITLEGVEDVERSLKQLGSSGEAALQQFRELGGAGQEPFTPLSDAAQKAGQAVNDFGNHSLRLSEIFHLLRPALQAAGVQIGEFGSLARIAGAGIGGLAIAATGAVIVAFARLEETLAATKGRLADLFGSQAAGEAAFAQLEKNIQGLGVTVSGLEPALESAKTALDRFIATTRTFKFVSLPGVDLPAGTAQNLKNVGDAVVNFFKLLRAGRLDATEAQKADKAFFDTLKEGGTVTAAALKNLPTATVQLLAEAMGRGTVQAEQFITEVQLAPIPVTKLIEALAKFGPQAQQAFDSNAIKGFGDAFNELLKAIQDGFKTVSGTTFSNVVVTFLENLKGQVKATKDEIQLFLDTWEALKNLVPPLITRPLPEIAPALPLPRPTTPISLPPGSVTVPPSAITLPPSLFTNIEQTLPQTEADLNLFLDKIDQDTQPKLKSLGTRWGEVIFGEPVNTAFNNFDKKVAESVTSAEGEFAQLTEMPPIDFTPMFSSFQPAMDSLLNLAQSTWQQIQAIFNQPIVVQWQASSNPFLAQQPTGLASGGLIRGPGSGTSDSILAWLSDKEFVINARAVSHYGPDLFAALNAMRLPRDFLSRFNMGGLVRAIAGTMPHFASGGMVASAANSPVTFVIDRQSFDVRASDQTIAKLRRYAVASRLSSAGRKPSWFE